MATPRLPVFRPKVPADLQRAREEIPWVDDDDLPEIERKSSAGTVALSFFTWGGGLLYVREYAKGSALIAGLFGWMALASHLVEPIGGLGYLIGGAFSALVALRKTKALNRYVNIKNELMQGQTAGPSGYRLLAATGLVDAGLGAPASAMPSPGSGRAEAASGRHGDLVDRLRKLAALRAAGVINPTELKDRKIDLLSAAAPASRADLDDLMFELLPLADEGVLLREDFDFLKQLGSST